jgi:signal transduction histidine kinase
VPWFAIAFSAALQLAALAIVLAREMHRHRAPLDAVMVVAAVAALIGCAALYYSRRRPGLVMVAVAVLCVPSIAFFPGPPVAAFPVAVAVVSAVLAGRRLWVWCTLAGIAAAGTLALAALARRPDVGLRMVLVTLALCLLVAIAEGARGRRERFRAAAREAAGDRRSALEQERLRIARELHDVLAHSLSQISVQAGMGLHLFDTQPEKAREALGNIKSASAGALEEVRVVLGALRDDADASRVPEPTLDRLSDLTGAARDAGIHVTMRNELDATDLALPVQAAIYRIVQESLTNVARHSGAHSARVFLGSDANRYEIVVENPLVAERVNTSSRAGRGIMGMRERCELFGGGLDVSSADGEFRVHAWFPRARAREGVTR